MTVKIFGREPSAVSAAVEATLGVLVVFNVFDLDAEHSALLVAVVNAVLGVYLAYVTKDTLLAAVVGAAKALLALAVGYGAHLTTDQVGVILTALPIILGLYLRTQTSPLAVPSFKYEPVTAPPANGLTVVEDGGGA